MKRRRARERQHLFVCEGVRSAEELLRSSLDIRGALLSPQLYEAPRGAALADALRERNVELAEVSPRDLASAADTESPQGILVIGAVPRRALEDLDVSGPVRLLLLDALQDPGNVGTILRTAAALGATGTISLPGTVDLWNAKVVRSSMGAHFHHQAMMSTWGELDAFRNAHSIPVWVADRAGEPLDAVSPPDRLALVVGNEGAGASAEARQRADRYVAIPTADTVESLNVAVATGILLHGLRR